MAEVRWRRDAGMNAVVGQLCHSRGCVDEDAIEVRGGVDRGFDTFSRFTAAPGLLGERESFEELVHRDEVPTAILVPRRGEDFGFVVVAYDRVE